MAKDPLFDIDDPICDECGDDSYLCGLDGQNLCHKCHNKIVREKGYRNHESQEWHDRLDRIIAGTATEEEQAMYKPIPKTPEEIEEQKSRKARERENSR